MHEFAPHFSPPLPAKAPAYRLDEAYNARCFALGEAAARCVPRRMLRGAAGAAGRLFARMNPCRAAVVARNLALLDPDPAVVPGDVYAAFAQALADYFHAGVRPAAAAALVDERLGLEHLHAARAAGRGALLLMPHLGCFELGGVVMRDLGYPMVALTHPEPSGALTAWRAAYRGRWGVETVVLDADPFRFLEVKEHLAANKFVAALFDRPHPTQSFDARVPGGTLRCSSGVLLLAMMAQCPVIPSALVAKPDGRYRIEALEPFFVERRGSAAETVGHYTQRLVDALLPVLRRNAAQWFQFPALASR